MEDKSVKNERPRCLVMFSGGMDSFLAACRAIESGRHAAMASFHNGAIIGEELFEEGAQRIIRAYGPDRASYTGCIAIAGTMQRLSRAYEGMDFKELAETCPELGPCQMRCLHCQTAMWACAIAYASAKGIPEILCGYREDDAFCTGSEMYRKAMMERCAVHGIATWFPCLSKQADWERRAEMTLLGFSPAVHEPKCMIGTPPEKPVRQFEADMAKYFETRLKPQLDACIKSLVPVYENITTGTYAYS